jgi:hypothetical protein
MLSKGFTLFMGGVASAMILTAAFAPGRQTVGGIKALGGAGAKLTTAAEGR